MTLYQMVNLKVCGLTIRKPHTFQHLAAEALHCLMNLCSRLESGDFFGTRFAGDYFHVGLVFESNRAKIGRGFSTSSTITYVDLKCTQISYSDYTLLHYELWIQHGNFRSDHTEKIEKISALRGCLMISKPHEIIWWWFLSCFRQSLNLLHKQYFSWRTLHMDIIIKSPLLSWKPCDSYQKARGCHTI